MKYLPLLLCLLLSACANHSNKIIPRPAPSVEPIKQYVQIAHSKAVEASTKAQSSQQGIAQAKEIARHIEASTPNPEFVKLQVALNQAEQDAQSAVQSATESAQASIEAAKRADDLQKEANKLADSNNELRKTVADEQEAYSKLEKKHDLLVHRINYYRVPLAICLGLLAGLAVFKMVPSLFSEYKLAAAIGTFLFVEVSIGGIMWWKF